MNDPQVLTPIFPSNSPPFPPPPIQVQLPREVVEIVQGWPTHIERTKLLEGRLGNLEGQVQPFPARFTALEAKQTSGPPPNAKAYLALVAWSCTLAGILLTLGGQFLWAHW